MTDPSVNQYGSSGTSSSLLLRVQACDQTAWERLVRLYGPMVFGWCLRAGLQAADAADVGQEVFAAVARAIQGFRHDRKGDTFRGWLYVITRNKLRDRSIPPGGAGAGGSDAQRRLAEICAEEAEPAMPPSDAIEADEQKALYRRATEMVRSEFETRTWDAFWRVFVDGDSAADVASDLGVSVNSVYLAKSRVLRRLREEFAALIDFGSAGAP
jgi:RNA polymerase sigma-70 factor, ECF subfamily